MQPFLLLDAYRLSLVGGGCGGSEPVPSTVPLWKAMNSPGCIDSDFWIIRISANFRMAPTTPACYSRCAAIHPPMISPLADLVDEPCYSHRGEQAYIGQTRELVRRILAILKD